MYNFPPRLNAGDKIGIVSPASRPGDVQKFQNGIQYLKKKGFEVVVAEHCLDEYGYLAGPDRQRADDIHQMFRDPQIKAIICSRGGYGTPRLLHLLDYDLIQKNPKIFVGYSDITALQQAFLVQARLVTFSGPMVAIEMGDSIDPFTETHFWSLLNNLSSQYQLNAPETLPFQVFQSGVAEGPLIGGCLSVLAPLIGTPYMPDYQGAILILEDIDEEPYSIDRNLSHLKAAGIFNQIRGIIFGQFLDSEPKDPSKPSLSVEQVFRDLLGDLAIPIVTNFAYGHAKQKYTIPFGVKARLDTDNNSLQLIEPVCC